MMKQHTTNPDEQNAPCDESVCLQEVKNLRAAVTALEEAIVANHKNVDDVGRCAIACAGQSLEFAKGLLALHNSEAVAAQWVVARSLIECVIRFYYLLADGNKDTQSHRLKELQLEAARKEKKYFDRESTKSVAQLQEVEEFKNHVDNIAELTSENIKPKTVSDMLEALQAGKPPKEEPSTSWYEIYEDFSAQVHSRITRLGAVEKITETSAALRITLEPTYCLFMYGNAARQLQNICNDLKILFKEREASCV